jgi:beta-glucosidase
MIDDLDALINQMTLEEKVSLLSGADSWHTRAIERLGIPAIRVTDGPQGCAGLMRMIQPADRLPAFPLPQRWLPRGIPN